MATTGPPAFEPTTAWDEIESEQGEPTTGGPGGGDCPEAVAAIIPAGSSRPRLARTLLLETTAETSTNVSTVI